jgi:hypothetical protein
VEIDRLHFLSGTHRFPSVVRVDTDRGIYFLDGFAPVPTSGTVYTVERQKIWGAGTQKFLCLHANLIRCWPILMNLGSSP